MAGPGGAGACDVTAIVEDILLREICQPSGDIGNIIVLGDILVRVRQVRPIDILVNITTNVGIR